MGACVFGNEFFDQWLNQKISNEDMLILSLKAQVNHFHHMDIEFRDEFKKINEKMDKKFDRLATILMWAFALFVTSQAGILIKLFF